MSERERNGEVTPYVRHQFHVSDGNLTNQHSFSAVVAGRESGVECGVRELRQPHEEAAAAAHRGRPRARGLEASGRPFVLIVKNVELELPGAGGWATEFEERNAGRGLVVRGWSPQLAALAHPAVGCFVTHCGWNSMLESIASGVPVVAWLHVGNQFMNARMAVEVLGAGVAVGDARFEGIIPGDDDGDDRVGSRESDGPRRRGNDGEGDSREAEGGGVPGGGERRRGWCRAPSVHCKP